MKTKLFFFALLASITASATVTVTPLSTDYSTNKVTFRVSWTGTAANNRVWVWVDLCPVTGITPGTFAKAVISNPSATAGSIETVSGNTRGFYVTTNSSTVTATLSNATGNFNWCAYGSDYPPNAIDNSSGGYALRGSPPFIITTSAGTTEVNANTFSGGTITALTDATGCPGALCGKNGQSLGLLNCCAYGTTNCSGVCTTNSTYTTNDGECTGACRTAYQHLYDQCGSLVSSSYSSYTNASCTSSCTYSYDCAGCQQFCSDNSWTYGSYVTTDGRCRCSNKKCPNQTAVLAVGAARDYTYSNQRWINGTDISATRVWYCESHVFCK